MSTHNQQVAEPGRKPDLHLTLTSIEILQHISYLGLTVTYAYYSGAVVKNLPANAGEPRFDPWVGKISGVGNGNPFQYSCLENSIGREAWGATVHWVTKNQIRLSAHTHTEKLRKMIKITPNFITQRKPLYHFVLFLPVFPLCLKKLNYNKVEIYYM